MSGLLVCLCGSRSLPCIEGDRGGSRKLGLDIDAEGSYGMGDAGVSRPSECVSFRLSLGKASKEMNANMDRTRETRDGF